MKFITFLLDYFSDIECGLCYGCSGGVNVRNFLRLIVIFINCFGSLLIALISVYGFIPLTGYICILLFLIFSFNLLIRYYSHFLVDDCKKCYCPACSSIVFMWLDFLSSMSFILVPLFYLLDIDGSWLRIATSIGFFRFFTILMHTYAYLVIEVVCSQIVANWRFLLNIALLLFFVASIFAVCIYVIEGNSSNELLDSIPEAIWWSIITICTVGYGDVVPITPQGKFIGLLAAVCGIFVIAIPALAISTVIHDLKISNKESSRYSKNTSKNKDKHIAEVLGIDTEDH